MGIKNNLLYGPKQGCHIQGLIGVTISRGLGRVLGSGVSGLGFLRLRV